MGKMIFGCLCDAIIHNSSRCDSVCCDEAHDILQFLTGLDASAGFTIIRSENHVPSPQHTANMEVSAYGNEGKSALFVDGRYELAAKNCVDAKSFDIFSLSNTAIIAWIQKNLPPKCTIAHDPRFFSINRIKSICSNLPDCEFLPIDLMSTLHLPKAEKRKMLLHNIFDDEGYDFCKSERKKRLGYIFAALESHNLNAYLLCNPCSIAWVMGIRDFGQANTPVVLSYLLVTAAHDFILYLDDDYENASEELSAIGITNVKYQTYLQHDLEQYSCVGVDESETSSHLMSKNLVAVKNPCQLLQCIKNEHEIEQIRISSSKDSAAIINFLKWIYEIDKNHPLTELLAAKQLLALRKMQAGFITESFRCIAAADDNAAIVHYTPGENTDKIIKNILLLDSGGQYMFGTTDITRTIALANPTEEQQLFYTLVLKGHIALAAAKFPVGTTGAQLDILARQFLHQYCADYNHSTGHGIGYLLNVHEGPAAINISNNVPLKAGMLLSNEPGYYKANEFGIRLENMMLVREENDGFLSFEMMSWVPFDWKFINKKLLTDAEWAWLWAYQNEILFQTRAHLAQNTTAWLKKFLETGLQM
ncbi:MAG: M24 family metallopeptidase [Holosporaceae bacterium]|jgi:Xaa-Pro aminopeptidase|nr:M24 family metallopeptidase [Holosporaceae bacterium]